jgi:predicted GNAT superfamily acetyltransferase
MPPASAARDGGTVSDLEIRPALREELPAAAELLARALRFAPADAIPAWLMRTTAERGGITLVAVQQGALVGVSYAFPAWEAATPVLFSCGLAVVPERRGAGIGRALKLEQRRRAAAAGYRAIRWTADPLNGRALRLYLSGLEARITGYGVAVHDGLRAFELPQDDVDVEWPLEHRPLAVGGPVETVELPWDPPAGAAALRWRLAVRVAMRTLLDAGFTGTGVDLDVPARRCAVRFEREVER